MEKRKIAEEKTRRNHMSAKGAAATVGVLSTDREGYSCPQAESPDWDTARVSAVVDVCQDGYRTSHCPVEVSDVESVPRRDSRDSLPRQIGSERHYLRESFIARLVVASRAW